MDTETYIKKVDGVINIVLQDETTGIEALGILDIVKARIIENIV